MATYDPAAFDEWEFKFVRATTARFRDPARLREVLDEEARAGWELVEKFDDHRVRLRRRRECRTRDAGLEYDPYRSHVGMSQGVVAVWIVLGVVTFAALVVGFVVALD